MGACDSLCLLNHTSDIIVRKEIDRPESRLTTFKMNLHQTKQASLGQQDQDENQYYHAEKSSN